MVQRLMEDYSFACSMVQMTSSINSVSSILQRKEFLVFVNAMWISFVDCDTNNAVY